MDDWRKYWAEVYSRISGIDSDDLMQDDALKRLQGKRKKQLFRYSMLDSARDLQKYDRKYKPSPLRDYIESKKHFDTCQPLEVRDMWLDFLRLAKGLPQQKRAIIMLKVIYGLTEKEIGDLFDLSESAISKILTKIKDELLFKVMTYE